MFQVVWKPVQNRAPDLFNFIENFSFDWGEYVELLGLYTALARGSKEEKEEEVLWSAACSWLKHGIELPDNKTQSWHLNFPVTVRNQLYIGKTLYTCTQYIRKLNL